MRHEIGRRAEVGYAALAFAFGVLLSASSAATLQAQARATAGNTVQVGDRILLRVTNETQLTDTFTVTAGPAVVLPIVGSISLAGVNRDSVERALLPGITMFFRDPQVHARVLMRVAVLGEVLRPGFYLVPSDIVAADVLMAGGGPSPTAVLDRVHIMRNGTDLLAADATKKAFAQGLTLSQIGLQSEDQFIVPKAGDAERTIRIITALIAIPVAVATIFLLTKR